MPAWAAHVILHPLSSGPAQDLSRPVAAVCTIHQPSIDIFEAFDELVLLKRGGETIYCGPLGAESCQLIEYFQVRLGPALLMSHTAMHTMVTSCWHMLRAVPPGSSPWAGQQPSLAVAAAKHA